jgi:hypothetical protein
MLLLQDELLVLDNEQRPANTPWVRVQPELPLSNVAYDGNLRVDIILAAKLFQSLNEIGGVTMNTHPDTVNKHLRCERR